MNLVWLSVAIIWLVTGTNYDNPGLIFGSIIFLVLAFSSNDNRPRPL